MLKPALNEAPLGPVDRRSARRQRIGDLPGLSAAVRQQQGANPAQFSCAVLARRNHLIQLLPLFVEEFTRAVYARPEYIDTLASSTPIADHVSVDFELRGCPIDKGQLLEVLCAFLHRRPPRIPTYSVCVECKHRGTTCVMVADGTPCLGPVTQAGCGALCPAYNRGCYGCFGPSESANLESLISEWKRLEVDTPTLVRALRTYNGYAPEFREASERLEATL